VQEHTKTDFSTHNFIQNFVSSAYVSEWFQLVSGDSGSDFASYKLIRFYSSLCFFIVLFLLCCHSDPVCQDVPSGTNTSVCLNLLLTLLQQLQANSSVWWQLLNSLSHNCVWVYGKTHLCVHIVILRLS
jgi:hypothetical protein